MRSDPYIFSHGDVVRLICETEGIAEGSEGEVIGWYANDPDRVLVMLSSGELHHVPVTALERPETPVTDSAENSPRK